MSLPPKPVSDSLTEITQVVLPNDANPMGFMLGGAVMHLIDIAGAIAALRHARTPMVTAAVDAMKFKSPVHVGDLVTLRSQVNAAWNTSMEVGVRVEAENVVTGEIAHTCTAYLTMVALGEEGRPVPLPVVEPESPDEIRRHRSAQRRRAIRISDPDASLHIISLREPPPT